MRATKDFRYYDFAQKRSVEVAMGDELDPAILGRNKVDVEKLTRTRFVESGGSTSNPKKRSRK